MPREATEDLGQPLGLRDGTRIAVQDESGSRIDPREPFGHEVFDQVVWHELAGTHVAVCLFAQWRAGLEGGTQDGAGREQEKALAVGEQASLRALADARGSEEDEDEGLVAAGSVAEAIGHG